MNAPPTKPAIATFTPAPKAAVDTSPSKTAAVKPLVPPPFAITSRTSETSRWFKAMFYGDPGAGKTTLVASSADVESMQDILYLDCEQGALTVEDNERVMYPEKILENRVEIQNFKAVAHVHDYLKGHVKHRDANDVNKLRETEAKLRGCSIDDIGEPKRFRTVLIDTLTEVDQYCVYNVLGTSQDNLLQEANEGAQMDVAGWPEFRKINQMMQMLLRSFRDLPINVLATAHMSFAEDEMKKRHYGPMFTGQLRKQVMGHFDVVGHMSIGKVGDKEERRLYVKPVGLFQAKNRRSVYKKDFFENPTMTTIMDGFGLLKQTAPSAE